LGFESNKTTQSNCVVVQQTLVLSMRIHYWPKFAMQVRLHFSSKHGVIGLFHLSIHFDKKKYVLIINIPHT